jgi:capsid protein
MAATTSKASTPKGKAVVPPGKKGFAGRVSKANKPNKARDAMVAMQAYCKFSHQASNNASNRVLQRVRLSLVTLKISLDDLLTFPPVKENRSKYKDLDFKERQKALGSEVSRSYSLQWLRHFTIHIAFLSMNSFPA